MYRGLKNNKKKPRVVQNTNNKMLTFIWTRCRNADGCLADTRDT